MNQSDEDRRQPTTDHFYEQIYGISRLSPRYWWRRRARHRVLWACLFLLTIAIPVGLVAGWPLLWPRLTAPYHAFRAREFNASAARFIEAGDAASARIQIQNSLRHDPANATTMALLARVMKQLDQPGYFLWALQAHLANPMDPRLARNALGAAIEEQQAEITGFLLREALPRFPKDAPLRILACHGLMQMGRTAAALREAQQAKKFAPDNAEAAFLVAALSARSSDARVRDESLATLRRFRDKPQFSTRASWAIVAALSPRDPKAALAALDELISRDPAAWAPHLRRATLSHRIQPASTPATLRALWAFAKTPAQRRAVIETAESLAPPEAQALLDALDPAEQKSLPFLLAQFRLWAKAQAWRKIADIASIAATHADSTSDSVTLGIWRAKAHKELGEDDARRTCLRSALSRCQGNSTLALDAALRLERLGLPDGAADFYALVLQTPGRLGVFARSRIAAVNLAAGRTTETLAIWQKALAANPKDPQAMNNVAACLLLLDLDPKRALQLAADAHAIQPHSVHYADTHALALAALGRVDEALAIHAKLPPRRLQQSEFALNYASVLARAGRSHEARALLTNVNENTLLPEQRQHLRLLFLPAPTTATPLGPSPLMDNSSSMSIGETNLPPGDPAMDANLLPASPTPSRP